MPRFSLLDHDWPVPHLDLFLEREGVLKAWRLPGWPVPGRQLSVEQGSDHRLLYLDYEGPVSGDRGRVIRRDHGEYTVICWDAGFVRVEMAGIHLRGTLQIQTQGPTCELLFTIPG